MIRRTLTNRAKYCLPFESIVARTRRTTWLEIEVNFVMVESDEIDMTLTEIARPTLDGGDETPIEHLFRKQFRHQKLIRVCILLGLRDAGNQQVALVPDLVRFLLHFHAVNRMMDPVPGIF